MATRLHSFAWAAVALLFLAAAPLVLGSRSAYVPRGVPAAADTTHTVVISAHVRDLTDSAGIYSQWPANPDEVVLNNSTGTAAMFYDNVNFSAATAAIRDSSGFEKSNFTVAYRTYHATQGVFYNGSSDTVGAHLFLKFNMSTIPADAHIISAYLCVTPSGNISTNANQYHFAVLDTCAADTGWYHPLTASSNPLMRQASWNRMRGGDASSGWADNGAVPFRWRDDLWDFGIPCNPADGPAGYTANTGAAINVAKPLQWWLYGGKRGNPFWVLRGTRSVATPSIYAHPNCRGERKPALIVTYKRGDPWRPAFGRAPMVVGFQSDDQDTANARWAQILESHGYRMTIFTTGLSPFSGAQSATKMTVAQLLALERRGHELGIHGVGHCDGDLAPWGWGTISVLESGADSLDTQTGPQFWYDAFGEPLGAWQYRSSAMPCGGFNPLLPEILRANGVLWSRSATQYTVFPVYKQLMNSPAWRTATSDSFSILRLYREVPIYQISNVIAQHALFGNASQSRSTDRIRAPGSIYAAAADTGLVEAFYDAIGQAQLNGNGPVCIFTHDTKVSTAYAYGVDYDELEWLCDEIDANPLLSMETGVDIIRAFRDHAYPVAPPAWTKSNTVYGHTASDSLWWYSPRRY